MGSVLSVLLMVFCALFHTQLSGRGAIPYSYCAAISNCVAFILLCKMSLRSKGVLSYFGRNSMLVMGFHMDIFVRIAWYVIAKLRFNFGETGNAVPVIALERILSPVFIFVINRFFPVLLKFSAKILGSSGLPEQS